MIVAWGTPDGIRAQRLVPASLFVFQDGFESGDASAWVPR